jgi:hypothetical protein
VNYEKNNASNTTLSTGWTTDSAGSIVTAGNTSNIRSTRTYGNFDFRMEYRNDGNQGIIYRHLLTGDAAWQTGVEFAVNNDSNKTKASPGAAYDLYAPSPNAYSVYGSGKWNSARIVAVGDSVEHWMNGVKVVGYKYHSPAWWTAYSASKWESLQTMSFKVPGNKTEGYITEGYLGLEGDHGGKWQIRNIRINSTNPKLGPP